MYTDEMYQEILNRYRETKCSQHGIDHIENVLNNSIEIANRLKSSDINLDLVKYIAIFHDVTFWYCKSSIFTYFGESYFVKKFLPKELEKYRISEDYKPIILNACIRHPHSFPFGKLNKKRDIYAQILQDADTIDSFEKKRVETFNKRMPLFSKSTEWIIEKARENVSKFLNLKESGEYFLDKMNEDFIPYKIFNPESNNVVVLLHGYADDISMWDHYIKRNKTEKIITINFPMNMKYQTKIFNMEDLALYIIDIINECKVDKFHLKGFSLGGLVAIEVASKLEERVLSLQLLSVYTSLLKNQTLKNIHILLHPFLISSLFTSIYSLLNTNPLIRYLASSPYVSKSILRKMRKNNRTLMGTLFNILSYDGLEKYKSFTFPKTIFVSLDDTVLNYKSVSKRAKRDGVELNIIKKGGHGEGEEYFNLLLESN